MVRQFAFRSLLCLAAAGTLSGCERETAPVAQQVRAIRAFTVGEAAGGQLRRFPGLIEARESTALSFQVGGNVREVLVNRGDKVSAGQVLATLDDEPYRLNVRAAEAEVDRARAYLAQARADYERHQRLLAHRAVAQVQFEVAQRNFFSSQSQVDLAIAKLDLARRDLRNTTLAAPFAGSIAARTIDAFVEVRAGQTVFRLDAAGGMEASIGVPETLIGQLRIGMPANVTVPTIAEPMPAQITEIGSAAGAGNTFPVKLALDAPPAGVRPGMTAEATLRLAEGEGPAAYLVPLAAIAPGERAGEGFVFVFDPQTATVRRTPVRSAAILAGNMVAVTGITGGALIANAGVSFLVDGQKVRLMPQATAPSES